MSVIGLEPVTASIRCVFFGGVFDRGVLLGDRCVFLRTGCVLRKEECVSTESCVLDSSVMVVRWGEKALYESARDFWWVFCAFVRRKVPCEIDPISCSLGSGGTQLHAAECPDVVFDFERIHDRLLV